MEKELKISDKYANEKELQEELVSAIMELTLEERKILLEMFEKRRLNEII